MRPVTEFKNDDSIPGPFVGERIGDSPLVIVPESWPGYRATPWPPPKCADPFGRVGPDGVWQVGFADSPGAFVPEADTPVYGECIKGKHRNDFWGRRDCRLERLDARCLKEAGGLVLLGDSITRYLYYQIACALRAQNVSVIDNYIDYINIKGSLPTNLPGYIDRTCNHMKHLTIRKHFGFNKQGWQTVAINPAGVWQAAYGNVGDWKEHLHKVIDAALDSGFRRVIWVATTAVHPVQYLSRSPGARDKWSLSRPRLAEINAYAAKVARERGLEMLDFWGPTIQRDMDPLSAGDMRHYGQSTTHELAQLLLREVCSPAATPAAAAAEAAWKPAQWPGARPPRPGTACETPFFVPCNSSSFPGFTGWTCLDSPSLSVGQGRCLGDPKKLDTCEKIVLHGNGTTTRRPDRHIAKAARGCACPPKQTGEVYKRQAN